MGTRTDKGTGMVIAGVLLMLLAGFSLFFTSNSIPITFVALAWSSSQRVHNADERPTKARL